MLCDPATGGTDFGFVQPVNVDRLVPVDLFSMAQPEGVRSRIEIDGKRGIITGQSVDGRVKIQFDGSESQLWVDLTKTAYIWLPDRWPCSS